MLFNSFEFLFACLPVTVAGYIFLQHYCKSIAIWWLVAASIIFYSVWEIAFLPVLVGSVLVNFLLSRYMLQAPRLGRVLLILGVAGNLLLLGYFKYLNFFLENINVAFDSDIHWIEVVLPIGISFFTFQQIAFLVDTYRGETNEASFSRYALFVSFFPQLIAGPIVHHKEMMGQFGRGMSDIGGNLGAGLTLLVIGLVKKVVVADTVAVPASAVFDAATMGESVGFVDAWIGVVAYALQIYFDFSAYSDMAIGLARMMGIHLPINFMSPYQAISIVDFWRRWHITLSRFLRDYLYFPLGGNRRGVGRQKINLMLTMALGGIWHGAGWTFLIWGLLHGFYLLVNHAWESTRLAKLLSANSFWHVFSRVLTLLCIIIAWVPFRAADLTATMHIWKGMVGLNGVSVQGSGVELSAATLSVMLLAILVALFVPSVYRLLSFMRLGLASPGYPATRISPVGLAPKWGWSKRHAIILGLAFAIVILKLNDVSEFIYFQF